MEDSSTILSPAALDHFEHPRNVGEFTPGPDVVAGVAGSDELGIKVRFSIRIAGDRVAAIRFRAYGCPHTIAAASWLTERFCGAAIADLNGSSWREVEAALAVPPQKRGRLLILEDAMRHAVRVWGQSR